MKPTPGQFFDAVSCIEQLTPAPRVLGQTLALLRDPNSDIAHVAALIKNDPALVADMIRGANSVFFGGTERVASLERALQKIGFRESIRLLNVAVTRIVANRDLEHYGISADDFWAESLFSGLFIKALAMTTEDIELDEAHTAGLLRFIGRLVIDHCLRQCEGVRRWDGVTPLEQWELETVGFTSGQAGALLLRNWRFPESLALAIERQGHPHSQNAPASWLADALQFTAAVIPQGMGLSFAVMATEYRIPTLPDTDFVRNQHLSAEHVTEIVDICRQEFISISSRLYGQESAES